VINAAETASFYVRQKRYIQPGASEVRKIRPLRDENVWLKRLAADLTLDEHIPT
jgi:hypothetical protein